ncbi:pseudouridine synthase [Lasiosphaeria hispida]|uniref:tRNA pseudouridine synthase 1 n=1 Tax=Lasiosphaeria hispida TaxID=260671 RepID=A0AAJ0HN29_9PEZI|nr:pseudouridine synthase [Lasiosphaeria hispida]
MATDETPSAATGAPTSTSGTFGPSEQQPHGENNRDRDGGRGGSRGRGKRGGGRGGGGRGGRGGRDRGNDKPHKTSGFGSNKRDLADKREQVQNTRNAKRQKVIDDDGDGNSYMSIGFTKEEIAAEERRPKRKVAVLIGYAGTGYHGIQINHKERTIEGDIFAAFVTTGAIAKANADDPKKSSLVRCARTDKGVHAAGNVLSLKLIVEDENLVEKLNIHLPEQIRVWAIQRTNNGFSCYQACDSRWYEYLMPSYALLPPQPQSFLGKKLQNAAKDKGVYEEYQDRLDDVKTFWDEVERNDILPILEKMDPEIRAEVVRIIRDNADKELSDEAAEPAKTEGKAGSEDVAMKGAEPEPGLVKAEAEPSAAPTTTETASDAGPAATKAERELTPVELAVREVKAAYIAAKRRYRVTPARLQRLQQAMDLYLGTHNFHNYTVLKSAKDPSAQRHIKSFKVDPKPIHMGDTEWLSIKIHGQSFMMHQIRKMIAMAVMVVRCGAPFDLISESYESRRISIPKAPGLGLMLERPMFTEFNKKAVTLGRDPIDFAKFEDKIQEFKDQHIYRRMFEVEEKENSFHLFFNQVDNFRTDYFLWVTAGGLEASHQRSDRTGERIPKALQAELGDDADGVAEEAN